VGKEDALVKMQEYNLNDVAILETIYNRLKIGFRGIKQPKWGWKD
jgi:hypothetical protein